MACQKIMDLFIATSSDYNPKSEEAYTFFKIVQNKLHWLYKKMKFKIINETENRYYMKYSK